VLSGRSKVAVIREGGGGTSDRISEFKVHHLLFVSHGVLHPGLGDSGRENIRW